MADGLVEGVADGLVGLDGLVGVFVEGVGAATAAGVAREADSRATDVTSKLPPRARRPTDPGDTERMKLSRPVSWFLLAFGVWSWVIWVTFVKNLVKDSSGLAFDDGHPTAYFWVHLTLAVVSFVLGTAIGVIGLRGLRALRRTS